MSPWLTNKRIITDMFDLPETRGLRAYRAGRFLMRDAGGHGDAGGDDTPPDGAGDDDTSDDDDDASDDDDDEKDPKGKGDKDDDEEVVPKWKYDKLHKRMSAADSRADTIAKQLDELKNSKDINADVKRELDEVKSNVAKIEAERDKLSDANRALTIKLASMTVKGVPNWVNAETALKLADLSDVDISDDGKVDTRALKSALNALAKEHPYLVVKEKDDNGGSNESGGGSTKLNGRRKGQRDDTSRDALASKFPVLRHS